MDNYTENLAAKAADFYEYDAEWELPRIIASFRGHADALSHFLDANGYAGEDTPSAKAAYLRQKFSEAGIESAKARNAMKWLTEPNCFERETGFRIAFALGLSVEGTDGLFRTVMLDRSFDCHTLREAIYYYCIYNGKNYSAAERLIAASPNPERGPVPLGNNVLYTRSIINFLRSCPDEETLLQYFRDNLPQFGYNQVKAKEYIQQLWQQISAPNGLAELERKKLPVSVKPSSTGSYSTWDLYLQILGLDLDDVKYIDKDRTIVPILDNKTFMHRFAADNFPTRQSIEKILRGVSTEHDLIRKTLILLVFYQFWIKTALALGGNISYMAGENDKERCLSELDLYLLDAGFPELYAGNPYDWIFIWAARREAPMQAFRSYWQLLSAVYSENRA